MEYAKRSGTSGIDGQLYETKLLALILFRLQHDKNIEYFNLATNIDKVGDFDDICLVMKKVGHQRPVAVFLQLKHKENDNVIIKLDNKDKVKYVDSFLKIKCRVTSRQSCDNFFNGKIADTDCIFVLYTNAKFNVSNPESTFASCHNTELNRLLCTSNTVGCRPKDFEQLVEEYEDIFLKKELVLLSAHFVEFLVDEATHKSTNIMNDMYIQQYHVILKRKVVDVSGIQKDEREPELMWRTLTFQPDFFTNDDKYILLFRNQLYKDILKHQSEKLTQTEPSIDEMISVFLSHPSAATLAPLIITYIESKEVGKLKFLIKRSPDDVERLGEIHIPQTEIDKAVLAAKKAAIEYLKSVELKVPIAFGNVDLAIRGTESKVNKRLKHLLTVFDSLCRQYELKELYKVVKIDDSLGDGLLSHNGGLAGAVGNLLIYDSKSKMLKFSSNFTSEQNNAKKLFHMVMEVIDDPLKYRFNIKTKKLPKLLLGSTDTAREFLSRLVIYQKQSNHYQVEEILKKEIEEYVSTDSHRFIMKSNQAGVSVFLHYHEEILKWWMTPTTGTYLNKKSDLYERAMYNLQAEPQMSALQSIFYMNNSRYFGVIFSKSATKSLELSQLPSKILIVTDTVILTTVKVMQCLRNHFFIKQYAVIDLEFVLNLPAADLNSLYAELRKSKKVLIIVWHNIQSNSDLGNRIARLVLATEETQVVVVTNNAYKQNVKEYFSNARCVYDTQSLTKMESQEKLISGVKVIFQGIEVSFSLILDNDSLAFVQGIVLDKVIRNETLIIGTTLSNPYYDAIKDLYIDRRISQNHNAGDYEDISDYGLLSAELVGYNFDKHKLTKSLFQHLTNVEYLHLHFDNDSNSSSSITDNEDDAVCVEAVVIKTFLELNKRFVLLTAPPGMGKSTLLTHLSLKTKERYTKRWILRVNFIDYSKQFHKWHDHGTVFDALESLKFLCQVMLRNMDISLDVIITEGTASLVSCTGDGWAAFELKLFLHYYNIGRLICIFDGFDEICPDYKDTVINFLISSKTCLRKNKMWVTSRPYSEILPELESILGKCFKIEDFSYTEQETYLRRFWREKFLFEKLNHKQLKKLRAFIDNTGQSISTASNWIRRIYGIFVDTVSPVLYPSDCNTDTTTRSMHSNPVWKRKVNQQINSISGIPLLLYFIADYFVNIVEMEKNSSKSTLEINLHHMYEMFIENKLKNILFQDKVKMDLSNIVTRRLLEKELSDCISIHKKLAAYPFFRDLIYKYLDCEEFKEMQPFTEEEFEIELRKIKTGTDKTGLISHVTADNIPVFIHRSFTEYFIAECICDIFISSQFHLSQKSLLYCKITVDDNWGVINWIDAKKEKDTVLQRVFREMEEPSPIYASIYREYIDKENLSNTQFIRILASSLDDYDDDCFSAFGDTFIVNYWNKIDDIDFKVHLIEFLKNYFISKMKPHLKKHFIRPITFIFLYKNFLFTNKNNTVNLISEFKSRTMKDSIDGIRFKIKTKGYGRTAPVFMLLKFNDYTIPTMGETKVLRKNYNELLRENIDVTDFIYILWVNVERDSNLDLEFNSRHINYLLSATGTVSYRLHHSEHHIKDFAEKLMEKEIISLAEVLESYLIESNDISIDIRLDMCLKRYHVLFKQKVFNVTEINKYKSDHQWRTLTFRDDFFSSDDKDTVLIRNCLLKQMLTKNIHDLSRFTLPEDLIPFFLSKPSATTLTPLLGTYIIGYVDGTLKFLIDRPFSDIEQLQGMNISPSTINEAKIMVRSAAIEYLRSLELKAPLAFGNVDVVIPGTPVEIKKRLEQLKSAIVKLCEQSKPHKVITIDDSVADWLLTADEGLASCLGNILIYDSETEMLKFLHLHQYTAAQINAKLLFLNLSKEIDNLHEYRFDVKTERLPKLRLDCSSVARQLLSKLVIYAEQGNYYEVEEISLIEEKQGTKSYRHNNLAKCRLIFLHCTVEILKWWMSSKIAGNTIKMNDLYKQAIKNLKAEPQLTATHNKFYFNNLTYFVYQFNEDIPTWIELPAPLSHTFIVTDTVTLTTVRVMQHLKNRYPNKNFTVLDFNTIEIDYRVLCLELKKTEKVVIIPYSQNRIEPKTLHELAQATTEKQIVVITNTECQETIQTCFMFPNAGFNYEKATLSVIQSHEELLKATKIIFQGREIDLQLILDDESFAFIQGHVLDKLIRKTSINIGTYSSDLRHATEEFFIYKRVSGVYRDICDARYIVKTFLDIEDDVVVVTAAPKTGKSTLLTHLTNNTKERNMKLWIVTVNFSKEFEKWLKNEISMNAKALLIFLCQVAVRNRVMSFNIELTNGEARLGRCTGNELAIFELKMFLHFYNQKRLIFIFDDFDTVSPNCRHEIVRFLKIVRNCLRKNKMWIFCPPDCAVLPGLLKVLDKCLTIK